MPTVDVISKQLIRQVVKDLALYLLDLEIIELEEAPTEKQRVETRQADIVMKAKHKNGQIFILHLELQNSNQTEMPLRMLRYYTDISLAYPGLPVHQYVIYTGKAKLNMLNVIDAPNWSYQYNMVDMHTLDCERFIAEDNPDALVLAILCDFKNQPPQQVLRGIIQRLIELTGNRSESLRNYLKMMELLSINRDLQQTFQQVEKDMLSNIQVDQLPSYQIGMEKGLEKGLEKGIQVQAIHTVKRMLQKGMDIDVIHQLTELSVDEIKQISSAVGDE